MELVYANQNEKNGGWTLSYKILREIQNVITLDKKIDADEIPSLEQIEAVLLAFTGPRK